MSVRIIVTGPSVMATREGQFFLGNSRGFAHIPCLSMRHGTHFVAALHGISDSELWNIDDVLCS